MQEVTILSGRTIQIYDSRNGKLVNLTTNENQWSRLIPLIEEEGINMSNVKAVVGSTKGTLELPDALIPEGNQQIILTPSKMKSGAVDKDFTTLGYNDLRRKAKELNVSNGLGGNPTRQQLLDAIKRATGLDQKVATKAAKIERKEKVETIIQQTQAISPSLEDRIEALETLLGNYITETYKITASFLGKSTNAEPIIEKVVKEAKVENTPLSIEEMKALASQIKG